MIFAHIETILLKVDFLLMHTVNVLPAVPKVWHVGWFGEHDHAYEVKVNKVNCPFRKPQSVHLKPENSTHYYGRASTRSLTMSLNGKKKINIEIIEIVRENMKK